MNTSMSARLLAAIAASALLSSCAPKDSSKPQDGQVVVVEKPAGDGKQAAAAGTPEKPATGKAEMKGLDPTPPLSRTDMGNGLVIEELKMGTGDIVWPGSKVKLNIRGWSVASGIMYWDTATQGGPKDVALANAMKGMRDGVPGMRVGGKRRLSVPTDMAYGFKEVKNEKDEVVVPQLTPIRLEIEVVEVLSKLNTEAPAAQPAPAPAKP